MSLYKSMLVLILVTVGSFVEASDEKPFATKHVILQVSDSDPTKYQTTLDIANNLIKHYNGPDYIDIEVIAFGRGINMYVDNNNPNGLRIKSLISNGVKFFVCLNTLDTIERKTSKRPDILEGVVGVQTGVAFMLEEITDGYTHIHP